ncbi:MAG TPA: HNH endonuclease signature motif containing protein [Burkholderiaceae bacterium]|nr:HNH endonuclease signature motif containing protein [Burkholderiaceae bacterium]
MSGFQWEINLRRWLKVHRGISSELEDNIVVFFEKAFSNTRCPQRAWFGVHSSRASLVVGGIYLAAIQNSGEDKGFWLLLDREFSSMHNIEYRPTKSTQRSKCSLIWAHSASLMDLPGLVINSDLWESFSAATDKILEAPIARDRDSIQQRRNKERLSEFWFGRSNNSAVTFESAVRSALLDKPEIRRKRLENAPVIPSRITSVSVSFARNPDVVAEVLWRADGYCEYCRCPAPFSRRTDKSPYLEVHHIKMLAEGGEDTVDNAVALCPNCHRQAHYA